MDIVVSVVVPCYNYGHYLAETLDSVAVQTLVDWECIIIDDGSTDNTKEVSVRYLTKDSRFRYIYQKNKGLSAARNMGIRNAKGKYIQFLDSDDLISSDKLQKQVEFLNHNSGCNMAIAAAKYFNDQHTWNFHIDLPQGKLANPFFLFLKENRIPVSAPLLRASAVRATGLFDETLRSLEDWHYWLRFHSAVKYSYWGGTEMGFTLIREHPNSMKRDSWRMDLHTLLIRNFLKFYIKNEEYLKINDNLRNDALKTLVYSLCKKEFDYEQKKERLQTLQKIEKTYKLQLIKIWVLTFRKLHPKLVWFLFEDIFPSFAKKFSTKKQ